MKDFFQITRHKTLSLRVEYIFQMVNKTVQFYYKHAINLLMKVNKVARVVNWEAIEVTIGARLRTRSIYMMKYDVKKSS